MNRKLWLTMLLLVAAVALAAGSYAWAQEDPPRAPGRRDRTGAMQRTDRGPLRGRMQRRWGTERVEEMGRHIGLVRRMRDMCFDPSAAGLLAVSGLADADAETLAAQLETVRNLGLRNAIRMRLASLYRTNNQGEKAAENWKAMLAENDQALSKMEPSLLPVERTR